MPKNPAGIFILWYSFIACFYTTYNPSNLKLGCFKMIIWLQINHQMCQNWASFWSGEICNFALSWGDKKHVELTWTKHGNVAATMGKQHKFIFQLLSKLCRFTEQGFNLLVYQWLKVDRTFKKMHKLFYKMKLLFLWSVRSKRTLEMTNIKTDKNN